MTLKNLKEAALVIDSLEARVTALETRLNNSAKFAKAQTKQLKWLLDENARLKQAFLKLRAK
jgi:hypothetical protein